MRLIDETAYQDKLAKIPIGERSFTKAVEIAQRMPTIDAVEVVRCRDCVHFGECLVTENDYCSNGEKKEATE